MTDRIDFRVDDLTDVRVQALIATHNAECEEDLPPEKNFALDVEGLKEPGVTFWSAWREGQLVGCGAIREFATDHAEIKSMHTARAHRGKGVAVKLLAFMLNEAKRRGHARVSLETGTTPVYASARKLYEKFGFVECGPFSDYGPDPYSLFMTKAL